MEYKIKENEIDREISYAVLFYNVILMGQFFVRLITNNREGIVSDIIKILSIVIQGLIFIKPIRYVFRRNYIKILLLYTTTSLIFLINIIMYNRNIDYILKLIFPFFFMCLPQYIYVISINNYDVFYEQMRKISKLSAFIGILLFLSLATGHYSSEIYSSGISYYILLPILIYISDFMNNPKLYSVFILSCLGGALFLIGSRGPLVSIIIFIILKQFNLRTNNSINFKKIIINVFVLFILILIFLNYRSVLTYMDSISYKYFGIRSRTINLLLNDINYSSGRDVIIDTLTQGIKENPIFGLGLAGDRALMGNPGLYSHNIFLELVSHYGIFIGVMLSVFLLFVVIKSLFVKNKVYYELVITWICIGFIPYLFSGSYLKGVDFWIMLALTINIGINKNSI